jgi:hypothetical protein
LPPNSRIFEENKLKNSQIIDAKSIFLRAKKQRECFMRKISLETSFLKVKCGTFAQKSIVATSLLSKKDQLG